MPWDASGNFLKIVAVPLPLNFPNIPILGLPRWFSGKESTCLCRSHRRYRFRPWVGKILRKRKLQFIPVFLPKIPTEELQSIGSQSDTTEQLSTFMAS